MDMDRSGLEVTDVHVPFDPSDEVAVTQSVHADKDPDTSQLILNQYQRGPLIGKGQHGEVFRCKDLSKGGTFVAMKVVSRKNLRQEKLQKLRRRNIPTSGNHVPLTDNMGSTEYKIKREIALMKRCRHPHVVRLLEVIDDKLYKKIYMIMEYLGGGEIKWRDSHNNPILKVDQTRRICRDVILGLEYLHAQGIIHRDIKPANLMWTEDRRTVKITDFGVAHISAAQRLRGSGDNMRPEDPDDALFLDDSDLAKTAGTPAFLAPEVVYDFGNSNDLPGSVSPDGGSSATLQASGGRRPPITKAIDVWALGVTMYSLLFGTTPFRGEGYSEFSLYQAICTQDWDVRPTMGVDQIPTGGRHPAKSKSREYKRNGATVVALLDRFLQKDAKKRITLDEVKTHPWILYGIADSDKWLRDTTPELHPSDVTDQAISEAISPLRFFWSETWRNRISSFFRPLRTRSSFRSVGGRGDSVGVRSAPQASMSRYGKRYTQSQTSARSRRSQDKQKGKERVQPASRPPSVHGAPRTSEANGKRSKSMDRRPSSPGPPPASAMMRRGSIPFLLPQSAEAPPLPSSARSFSPTSSTGEESPGRERPRSRFSLTSFGRWRVGRNVTYGPGPHEASTSASPGTTGKNSRQSSGSNGDAGIARASDEVLAKHAEFAHVTPAIRASSWGDVGEYRRRAGGGGGGGVGNGGPASEVTSVHSGEHDALLDDDVLLFGAGGVAAGPSSIPSTPSGGLIVSVPPVPHFAGLDAFVAADAAPTLTAVPHDLRHPVIGRDPASQPDPAALEPHAFSRHASSLRPHAPSPLVNLSASSEDGSYDDDDDDDDDDSSFFARTSEDVGDSADPPTTREIFMDEDEDSSGSEDVVAPLEVRRRRPSWAVAHPSPPTPSDGESDGGDVDADGAA